MLLSENVLELSTALGHRQDFIGLLSGRDFSGRNVVFFSVVEISSLSLLKSLLSFPGYMLSPPLPCSMFTEKP